MKYALLSLFLVNCLAAGASVGTVVGEEFTRTQGGAATILACLILYVVFRRTLR